MVIRWKDGGGNEEAMVFLDDFYIGRGADCRVRFYDPLVSRRHARVYRDGDLWRIEDLGSRNGTLLGEKKIEEAVLGEKNEIRVNEAGPVLHLDPIPAGAETRAALSTIAPGRTVAHVRATPGSPDA
ncbi:MAG TPA: FHA domain-containing protein [Deltaproteobacteria bacterium]|nr:FHA domain-containing protein [Deltaproteobacteria bacterium]